MGKPATVEEYIASFPKEVQEKLQEIRAILKEIVPHATEELKWGQPAFVAERNLFVYAAFKDHMNFVPTGPALAPFKKELEGYKTSKDSVQFPYDKPLPKALIKKIAEYRVKDLHENDAKWKY